MPRFLLLFALLALVAAAGACGDSATTTTVPAPAATTVPAPTVPPPTTAPPPTVTTVATPATTVAATTTIAATTTTTVPPTTTTVDDGIVDIDVGVVEGQSDGEDRYEVDGGSVVRITVVADVADEVHVHGYDIFGDVAPEAAAVIEFTADIPGIFEVELEGSRMVLFELVVGA
jgi:hypothetical protein